MFFPGPYGTDGRPDPDAASLVDRALHHRRQAQRAQRLQVPPLGCLRTVIFDGDLRGF